MSVCVSCDECVWILQRSMAAKGAEALLMSSSGGGLDILLAIRLFPRAVKADVDFF